MKLFILSTILVILTGCSQQSKDDIIGKWEFEKFETSDNGFQLADSLKEMRSEMEKANRGLIFSFQKDGKLSTYRRTGNTESFISITDYKLQGKNTLFLTDIKDGTSATVSIHFLSSSLLKISFNPNQYDIGVFKKIKP